MISEKLVKQLEQIEQRTGKTPSALRKYRDAEKRAAGDDSTRTGRFLASTANAMVGNFGDEALDWLGATEAAEGVRNRASRLREENPGLALLGDVVGFAAPGGAIGKAVGFGAKGISAGSRIARGGTAGAIEGAIFEAGNADGQSASERVDEALRGAAIGGTIGGLFGVGGAVAQRVMGNKPNDEVAKLTDKAVDEIAQKFSISKERVIASKDAGETLDELALNVAKGDVNKANQLMIPFRTGSEEVQGALGRAAEQRVEDVNKRIVDESSTVVDDLTARSTADELSPNAQTEFSQANTGLRDEAGDALGTLRTTTPVNTGGAVGRLITNPKSGVAAKEAIEQAAREGAKTETSDQIQDGLGEKIGELVAVTPELAKKEGLDPAGGLYVKTKETVEGSDKPKTVYKPSNLTVETVATAAQNRYRAGSDLADNSAEDARNATAEGIKQIKLAREMLEAIGEDTPEIAARNLDFIRNDAQERVNRLVGNLLKSKDKKQAPKLSKRISEIVNATTRIGDDELPNITPEQIMLSVRAALSDAVEENSIKTFDEVSSQVKTVRELMQKSGVPEESITKIVNTIRSNVNVQPTTKKVSDILDKSSNPKEIGKALAKAFDEKSVKETVINELGEKTGQTYINNLNRALKELDVLSKSASKSGVVPPPDKSFGKELLKNSVWYSIIVNNPVTAAGLTIVRTMSATGMLGKVAKDKSSQKAIVAFIESNPGEAAKIAQEELLKKQSYAKGRLIEKIGRRMAVAAGVPDAAVDTKESQSTTVPTPVSRFSFGASGSFTPNNGVTPASSSGSGSGTPSAISKFTSSSSSGTFTPNN